MLDLFVVAQTAPVGDSWYQLNAGSGIARGDRARMSVGTEELTAESQEQLGAFRDLLIIWNRRFNLTAIEEPAAIDRRLIGDALRMLPAIDDAIAAHAVENRNRSSKEAGVRLIDIGSGAGFPGMVLKICRPELDVTLLESTGKKVGFLDHVIADLGLKSARAIHARAEDLGRDRAHRERYDIVTARAVSSIPALMELCTPFLRVGGHAIFPKGMEIAEELANGERAAVLVGARIVSHDLLSAKPNESVTRLVIAVKIEPTPDRYPRRAGVPTKDPLGRVGT